MSTSQAGDADECLDRSDPAAVVRHACGVAGDVESAHIDGRDAEALGRWQWLGKGFSHIVHNVHVGAAGAAVCRG